MQVFDASDFGETNADVPCTCTLQFLVREDRLHLVTNMRSNDIILGLTHDVFCFTMLQEILARQLGFGLGSYSHIVGSLHLYDKNLNAAQNYLKEGWQPTTNPMPPMPPGDPWPALNELKLLEANIRTSMPFEELHETNLDPYWADIAKLFAIFRSHKEGQPAEAKRIIGTLSSEYYAPFVTRFAQSAS